jgi:predicted metal-dependent hydrolase
MTDNIVFVFLILLTFIVIYSLNKERINNEVTYVQSKFDNRKYLVRNVKDKQEGCELLAKIRAKLEKISGILNEKYGNEDRIKRLMKKFNPDKISETGVSNKYTSYSINKGEKIVLCLRAKDENQTLIDENTITFVALHELAHIMTKSIGHKPEFWDNFKFILKEAVDNEIYIPEDYKKSPKSYCGIMVTDNPLLNY